MRDHVSRNQQSKEHHAAREEPPRGKVRASVRDVIGGGRSRGIHTCVAAFERLGFDVYVARLKLFFQRFPHLFHRIAYVATVSLFLGFVAQFYIPGKGFTYLVMFGGKVSESYIPALRAINHY